MTGVDFTSIIAWQKSHQYVLRVYDAVKVFPDFESRGLLSQFTRAAVSVAANIAEGTQKNSKADKMKFLNIAQGSLSECRYYNILSRDLHYIDVNTYNQLQYAWEGTSFFLNKYIEGIDKSNFSTNI